MKRLLIAATCGTAGGLTLWVWAPVTVTSLATGALLPKATFYVTMGFAYCFALLGLVVWSEDAYDGS